MITLQTIADHVGGRLIGDGTLQAKNISSISEATEGDITFLLQPGFKTFVKNSRALAIVVGDTMDLDEEEVRGKNIITVSHPAFAYIKVAKLFEKPKKKEPGVAQSASVAEDASIAESASIAPFARISRGAVIGSHVVIHPFVFVGENVVIGEGSTLYPHVVIYDDVRIGKGVTIHSGSIIGADGFGYIWDGQRHAKIPQLGTVEIQDDVEIGANVTIDRASLGKTVVGKGARIDNLVMIAHNVSIGENSIIVAQVGIAGSTVVGRNVILAGQVGVKDHVKIGDNVKAGGGTGITKDVPSDSIIAGNPHTSYRDWARLQAYLKKLPKLFERMKKVEEKLHVEENHG